MVTWFFDERVWVFIEFTGCVLRAISVRSLTADLGMPALSHLGSLAQSLKVSMIEVRFVIGDILALIALSGENLVGRLKGAKYVVVSTEITVATIPGIVGALDVDLENVGMHA
jgi:hypothetical protein